MARARVAGAVGRAVWRTLRAEVSEGTLASTVVRSVRARTLAFSREPGYGELLASRASACPNAELLCFENERITAGQLDARANAVAAGLARHTRRGDHVAIVCPNCPAFLDAFFAIQKLGLGAVPVNTALVGDGLVHVLHSSRARVAFVHRDLVPRIDALRARLPDLQHVVAVAEEEESSDVETMEGWRKEHLGAPPPSAPIDPDAVSLLLYTSGTTGAAKGVVQRYGDAITKRLRFLSHLLYEPSDVLYTCLPLFHANALLLTVVQAVGCGARIALGRRFHATRLWTEAAQLGATTFNALGAMIPILLAQPPSAVDRAHRVRLVVSAACPAAAWEPFERRFGVRIVEGYGAVDGGGFMTMNLGNAPAGSIGRPLGGKYRLVDESGHDVRHGEPGELWVRARSKRRSDIEYYGDDAATRDKTRGGWIRTGDVMRRGARGFLYFVGRRTDSMRRRGENVSAYEVESAVAKHPDVLECAVFGVPSDLAEDDIMAVVVPREGRRVDPRALRAFLENEIARHALPRFVDVLRELPKTETHRVRKSDLARRGVTKTTWDFEKEARR